MPKNSDSKISLKKYITNIYNCRMGEKKPLKTPNVDLKSWFLRTFRAENEQKVYKKPKIINNPIIGPKKTEKNISKSQ